MISRFVQNIPGNEILYAPYRAYNRIPVNIYVHTQVSGSEPVPVRVHKLDTTMWLALAVTTFVKGARNAFVGEHG